MSDDCRLCYGTGEVTILLPVTRKDGSDTETTGCPSCIQRELESENQRLRENSQRGFYRGVCTALSCVDVHDDHILYREIVNACGSVGQLWQLWSAASEYDREHLSRNGYGPESGQPKSTG